jgi:hypothetical protein
VRFLAVALTAVCALMAGTSAALAGSAPTTAPGARHEAPTQAQVLSATAARTVSPLFTCSDHTICLFPNDDFTGNYGCCDPAVLVPADIPNLTWFSFFAWAALSPNPGSMNNDSGSCIWLYDRQAGISSSNPKHFAPGRYDLKNMYGYFEVSFEDPTCSNGYTKPLP